LGLENAGFQSVYVNELVKEARDSYLINRSVKPGQEGAPGVTDPRFHSSDIKDLVKKTPDGRHQNLEKLESDLFDAWGIKHGEIDLVTGGPPCQGYSGIGIRRSYSVEKEDIPSNHLFEDMATVIRHLEPRMFLFENVRGLLTSRWHAGGEKIFDKVLKTFEEIENYSISYKLVRAAEYGVPQNRPRVLLVGIHDKTAERSGWSPDIDANEHKPADGLLPIPSGAPWDIEDVLGDLVDDVEENWMGGVTERYPKNAPSKSGDTPRSKIRRYFRTRPNGSIASKGDEISQHKYSLHSPEIYKKFSAMISSRDGSIPLEMRTKKFAQRLLPKRWKGKAPNITATSLPDDYVHYSQPRILSVREWARLQTFPDWYQFSGKRTTGGLRRAGNPREGVFERELPMYTQIGNAVPVLLAQAVGSHFIEQFLRH
jgi:DNA (cytosine-5)-methyltransferase 1